MKESLKRIFAGEYVVLMVVGVVLLISIYTMELFFYTAMNAKQDSQNLMINKTSDIIHYANNYT